MPIDKLTSTTTSSSLDLSDVDKSGEFLTKTFLSGSSSYVVSGSIIDKINEIVTWINANN